MDEIDQKNRCSVEQVKQREIARLIGLTGQLLFQHGAESKIICDACERLGLALGLDQVEMSLSANAIVVTAIYDGHCITTTRRSPDRGINMQVVIDVHAIIFSAEREELNANEVKEKLDAISPKRYNALLVAVLIGLSCASFSRLSGGDERIFLITFLASFVAMLVRQQIAHRHFNPLLNFACAAFVATTISSSAVVFSIGNLPEVAMASSVLFLVPGFPLVNAMSDAVKGYTNMALARWTFASLLIFATVLGILAGMNLTGVWG